jgi:hypothetical protein
MASKRFPTQPMIGLLVRMIYQHYSQAMVAALREAGFDDIGPSAGNVFPFVGPKGITRVGVGAARPRADAGGRAAGADGLRRAEAKPE